MAIDLLTDARKRLLDIRERPGALDDLAARARETVGHEFLVDRKGAGGIEDETEENEEGSEKPRHPRMASDEHGEETDEDGVSVVADGVGASSTRSAAQVSRQNSTQELLAFIRRQGIGAQVLKLTSLLNKTGMDEIPRMLLSTQGIYEAVLLKLLKDEEGDPKDVEGLRHAVVVEVQDRPRSLFLKELLGEFIRASKLRVNQRENLYTRLLAELERKGAPLGVGRTSPALKAIFDDVRSEGNLRDFVDLFADRGEIEAARFTTAVRESMVDSLELLGLRRLNRERFDAGEYDEYFSNAYMRAIFDRAGLSRPIPVKDPADDFELPSYDEAEEQGVVPASIFAAAALYQIYFVGDKLGLLEMPNALLARRIRGKLDLPSGEASRKLQEYKKFQRVEDVQPEERMMLYKRVFNFGSGEVLDDTVVNDEFRPLWDSLMSEGAEYIRKSEDNDSDLEDKISRAPIDEAVRNLQQNLSFFGADIDEDVRLMREQYKLAEDILGHEDILASVGLVRRKSLQAVIERLVAENKGSAPLVRTLFTLGTRGKEILQYVATFDVATPEDEFRKLIENVRRWIIAQAAIKDEDEEAPEEEEEDDDMDAGEEEEDEEWDS